MDFVQMEEVQAGWSRDKKYHAWGEDGKEYFLRLSSPEKWERMQQAFGMQKKAFQNGLPVSRPVELTREATQIRFVEEWIPGQMAKDALPPLSQEEQYHLGWDAGKILQALHSVPAPADTEDWEKCFSKKIDQKIALYEECPYSFEQGQVFLQCISANRHLLQGRPQCLLHGDYHTGNMMVWKGQLYIIDFDRPKTGDPWLEFNRIVWSAQLSPAFASGTVDGYFDGKPPLEFWNLLALYIAVNTLSSLPWAVPFGEGEIATMQAQAKEVLEWYDGMKRRVPRWYTPGKTLEP